MHLFKQVVCSHQLYRLVVGIGLNLTSVVIKVYHVLAYKPLMTERYTFCLIAAVNKNVYSSTDDECVCLNKLSVHIGSRQRRKILGEGKRTDHVALTHLSGLAYGIFTHLTL